MKTLTLRNTITIPAVTVSLIVMTVMVSPASEYKKIPTRVEIIERPAFRVGDSWTYKYPNRQDSLVKHQKVVDVKDNLIKMEESWGNESFTMSTLLTADGNIVSNSMMGKILWQHVPFYPALKFPLSVGKKWHDIFQTRSARNPNANPYILDFSVPAQLMAEVESWENVSVQAGEFKTLKINYLIDDMESGTQRFTCWYSPEVKQCVARIYNSKPASNTELTEYKVDR